MIAALDHLVLTVASIEATVAFYTRVLGMEHVVFDGRHALHFGRQKINLHEVGKEFSPRARLATAGSGDLCFLLSVPLDEAEARLRAGGVAIEEGPVARTGAAGPLMSLYFRDPDGNLIEVSTVSED